MTAAAPLLTPADLAILGRLGLDSLDALLVGLGGERQGPGRSAGYEFIDYRRYVPGDDVRRIDWNAYARLRELHVRTAPREARVALALLVDTSRSMQTGSPSRLRHSLRLATLLAAVALLQGDTVQVHALSDGDAVSGGLHDSSTALVRVARELETLRAGTTTDLASSVRGARDASGQAGLAVLITDMLVPSDARRLALRALGRETRSAALLHVIADDATVLATGDARMIDSETGETLDVTLDEDAARRYADLQDRFVRTVAAECRSARVRHRQAPVSVDPLDLLLDYARSATLVSAGAGR